MKFRDYFSLKHIIFAVVLIAIMMGFAVRQSNNVVKVSFENTKVCVHSSRYTMNIAYEDIESVSLDSLGDPGEKLNEDAWDDETIRFGDWINDAWGEYSVCVDPDTQLCIVVKIDDGRTLVFSRKNNATTKEIYETLLEKIEQ